MKIEEKAEELAEPMLEEIRKRDKLIEKYRNMYEQDMQMMEDRLKKLHEEKFEILAGKQPTYRGENMTKVRDIKELGDKMIRTLRGLATAEQSAREKRKFLKEFLQEEDLDDLAKEISLEELQQIETEDIVGDTQKKIDELGTKLEAEYERYLQQQKPDFSPSQSELERRKHAQASVQERLNGIQEPSDLVNAFDDILTSQSDAHGKEAYSIILSRLKNQGDPAAKQRLEKLRRTKLLSEEKKTQLENYEQIRKARDMVEMIPSEAERKVEEIHEGSMTEERTSEYLEDSLEVVIDEAVGTMETEDEGKAGGAGWEG